jgi:D-alanyl-D-alanine carboxypeptidase/D-alanyl-D-alanine-endopeptidase (penicillin-binding protein 4)
MRTFLGALASVIVACCGALAPAAAGQTPPPSPPPTPVQALDSALHRGIHKLGSWSGAYVLDLTTGQMLYGFKPDVARTPASVEKLYTTSVVLLEFGPQATLSTNLYGTGYRDPHGTWQGRLYLRGGGDPTFGSAAFDRAWYGGGATIGSLVANLQAQEHLRALHGPIVGDAGYFDALPSTIESNFAFDPYMEGSLSALAFNRGVFDGGWAGVRNPPVYAAGRLALALRYVGHVKLARHQRLAAGATPAAAQLLASVNSPPMATLIALTNTPSDNFFAETLTKDLGARFGSGGTTAAGVAVIKAQLLSRFSLAPVFDDGSGLSYDDATTPREVVALLSDMAGNPTFVDSLALAGETGTLQHEMNGTIAQGNCRGKTGTLADVASLAGYCTAADGHRLAFAFLANRLGDAELGHRIEAAMAVSLAKYAG